MHHPDIPETTTATPTPTSTGWDGRPPADAPPAPEGAVPFVMVPSEPREPRIPRRIGGLAAAGMIAAVVAAWAIGHQVVATAVHAEAWPVWAAADAAYDEAAADYRETAERAESAIARGDALVGIAVGDLVAEEDRANLEARIDEARELLADRPSSPGIAALGDPGSFAPAWERYADLVSMIDLVPSREEAAARYGAARDVVAGGSLAIADATETLIAGTEARAVAAVEQSPSATVASRVAVDEALAGLRRSPTTSSGDSSRFADLAAAVDELHASHAAEVARLAEFPVRAEIEAFARSISFDVPFDVTWAYEVGGFSSDGYYSGTAEFFQDVDGEGWGLISLTHSIEEAWSFDENAEAVVVHEVGHVQVLREECATIFDGPEFAGDHEVWATAWAIGMGYDLPGAGIEAYGRPSDAQIQASTACR
ncbi:hypothetical protein GCM10017608_22410 [Agromyces luteolus]|uniref:Uncharacterized protein n=1 Tax=Agromyces luteolus TaxID=88373 RepID=A0A7C9HFY9_9MICO|nr:hypothetical protein [Agromyces luteolus]MUN05968.1 hypothetical protein [Agromyces luteolus]GLK28307.1 hypothetical protein GCM10017608_22410 [Agromyces luteolus]